VDLAMVKSMTVTAICFPIPDDYVFIETWENDMFKGIKLRVRPLTNNNNGDGGFDMF
jgi:hypothetical protein